MSNGWTQGAWRTVPPDESGEEEWGVCLANDQGPGWVYIAEQVGQEESEANANLIAAAPDLYAALEEMIRDGRMAPAIRALAKARGEV